MKKITGYLIDVEHNVAAPIVVDKSLDSYYKILNCEYIDIVCRHIGERTYDIICDDEALLKYNSKISAINSDGKSMLCGNLFIVKFDGVEDETSLERDDIAYINRYIRSLPTRNYPTPYPMLIECNY